MRVAITEGPRFLTDALHQALLSAGDEVVRFTRTPRADTDRRWDIESGRLSGPGLDDVDAVVNLSAVSAARRWSPAVREAIRRTPVTSTLTIVSALEPQGRCQRFLTLSSTAFYGDKGDEPTTVDDPRGEGFLARAAAEGEASARHAPVPTSFLRTPSVLARGAGYLAARRGFMAGQLGDGHQYRPWVHLDDWTRAVLFLLGSRQEGPVNMVAPDAVPESTFARHWARARGRQPGPAVPASLLAARYGADAAREVWLTSTRAVPLILDDLGFEPRFATLEAALADVVG